MEDLVEAVKLNQNTVTATLADYPALARRFISLGNSLEDNYSWTEAIKDLKKAVKIN